ncbi:unnamed protein product [Mytilus coruscus]|uniref:Integrase catalytic domain-containing protein n=1 Tax=Mytilus coruscus TaxID=42192 RepID=A0A6J8AZG2_MYTCO|nr:unnamed protein product [Mytilus coruscus]
MTAGKKHQNADALSRKNFEDDRCSHLREGKTDATCQECLETGHDWDNFRTEVDNIGNLSKGEVSTHGLFGSIRTVTRSQTKDTPSSKVNVSNWFTGYTSKEIEALQREDTDLGRLREWKDTGSCPTRDQVVQYSPAIRKYWLSFNNIVPVEGVLYQKRVHSTGTSSLQILVPKVLRQEVITMCHDHIFGAHMGVSKTIEKLKSQFHWYCMGIDVKSHIKHCPVCNRFKKSKKPRASLQNYIVGHPTDRIALDVIGPLPKTKRSNQYILVIGDHFTRWMEAYPLPNQQAEHVAEKLVHEFIGRFGIPLEIHTDQGRNFESDLFKEICTLLEIKKTRSTPYRPSSNGLIEKFNQTLEKMLRSFINNNKTNWDQFVWLLLAAYRSTPHPATGFTPNFLMFGREVNLPNHILFPLPKHESLSVGEYASNLHNRMEEVFKTARESLQLTAERQKKDYDTRLVENKFTVGSLVYKSNTFYRKLDAPWSGPYVVMEILSPVVYKIRNQKKTKVIHHDRLKPYSTQQPPSWVHKIQSFIKPKVI